MVNFFGTISLGVTIGVILAAALSVTPARRRSHLFLAGGVGAWIGLVGALTASGVITRPQTIAFLFAPPLLITGGLALWSPAARSWMLALPQPLLIRLNAFRVLGFFFLLLAGEGRLAGPFAYFAGIGDIITGAFALPVAALAVSRAPRSRFLIGEWTLFGALDLVVAVALGITSINGSPLQLIHAGVGSGAILTLPWVLIPTTLVPFFLITHGIIFAQLLARKPVHAAAPTNKLGWQEP